MKPWSPFDVPYDLHTGRELEFMLTRGKPLAAFSDSYPPVPPEDTIPRKAFAPHVARGDFEMRIYVEPLAQPPSPDYAHVRGTIRVLYARSSEAWRIDAYIGMWAAASKCEWSEELERLEGTLLGYSDWENDAHIEHALRSPHALRFPWLRRLAEQRANAAGSV
jgi:hypothetical protein